MLSQKALLGVFCPPLAQIAPDQRLFGLLLSSVAGIRQLICRGLLLRIWTVVVFAQASNHNVFIRPYIAN